MRVMEIRIRPASLKDVEHLVHHRREMFVDMGYKNVAELDGADDVAREYFNAALRDGSYKGWLAEDVGENAAPAGEVVGEVVGGGGIVLVPWAGYPGEPRTQRVWILNMYTEPRARRLGIAKKLVNIMTDWCRAEGFTAVSLHASDAGRLVYEPLGFRPSNEMKLSLR
jgi:GNAT superfamily N-acetyltransferase